MGVAVSLIKSLKIRFVDSYPISKALLKCVMSVQPLVALGREFHSLIVFG